MGLWCVCVCVCGAVPHGGGHDRVGEAGEWERREGACGSSDPAGAGGSGAGDSPQQIRAVLTQAGCNATLPRRKGAELAESFHLHIQPLDNHLGFQLLLNVHWVLPVSVWLDNVWRPSQDGGKGNRLIAAYMAWKLWRDSPLILNNLKSSDLQ